MHQIGPLTTVVMGYAEIDSFDIAAILGINNEVFRLYIAMRNFVVMTVGDDLEYLFCNVRSFSLC